MVYVGERKGERNIKIKVNVMNVTRVCSSIVVGNFLLFFKKISIYLCHIHHVHPLPLARSPLRSPHVHPTFIRLVISGLNPFFHCWEVAK